MVTLNESLVPKVHPLDRAVEAEDPMELTPNYVVGDPDYMLQCMIEEFGWMGWDAEQLMSLFHNPEYPVLNELRRYFGEDHVRKRIDEFLSHAGVLRFTETIEETPDPDLDNEEHDHEPELLQLTVRRRG